MKYSKKFLLLLLSIVTIMMAQVVTVYAEEGAAAQNNIHKIQSKNTEAKIVYVVKKGQRSRIAKYLYKDLIAGLKKAKQEVTIDFVDIKDLNDSLLNENDVLILVSEGTTINPIIKSFSDKNKANPKILVLAFYPNKSTVNTNGVDALTSASPERFSQSFVIKEVSQKVVYMLDN